MNKKGFTLIEMLVVIAIIAVLVAIIIPVVGNSTVKASAATNAANLRSYKASISTAYITNSKDWSWTEAGDVTIGESGADLKKPESVACGGVGAGVLPTVKYLDGEFTVTYGTNDIAAFAAVASSGDASGLAAVTKPTKP